MSRGPFSGLRAIAPRGAGECGCPWKDLRPQRPTHLHVLQPVPNHNPWMLLYFISFLLIVSFFVLNMFVGVVVENFHKCRQHQEAEEARRREEKRQRRLERKRRSKAPAWQWRVGTCAPAGEPGAGRGSRAEPGDGL